MRTWERSCAPKARFKTRREVRRARRHGSGTKLHIYRCVYCGFFHLGHIPPEVANGAVDKDEWLARPITELRKELRDVERDSEAERG